MSLSREAILERLRSSLRAAIKEARKDPEFIGKVAQSMCAELGLDQMASGLLAMKLKEIIRDRGETE